MENKIEICRICCQILWTFNIPWHFQNRRSYSLLSILNQFVFSIHPRRPRAAAASRKASRTAASSSRTTARSLQDVRNVIDTITFFAVSCPENSASFGKIGKFSESYSIIRHFLENLWKSEKFSWKSAKIAMKILFKNAKTCEFPWKCLQNLQKVWRHFAEILRVERCKGMSIW